MKIEKVNDHQIRCTLTREDLTKRQLKVSELAYGTDKARELFQEMMHQANTRFGFNAEDVPLMIEAIPVNSECIILVITKSEDPEELDTRFSEFGPSVQDDNASYENGKVDYSENTEEGEDEEVMDLVHRLQDGDFSGFLDGVTNRESKRVKSGFNAPLKRASRSNENTFCLFKLGSMHDVLKLPALLPSGFHSRNTLFRNEDEGGYLLCIYGNQSDKYFNNLCNLFGEYAIMVDPGTYSAIFLEEHYPIVIADNALQKLAEAN